MQAFVDARVKFDLERRDDSQGRRVLGVIRRVDLIDNFKDWVSLPDQATLYGTGIIKGCKARELKALADAAMRARGRPLHPEVNLAGGKVFVAYKNCCMV